MKGYLMLWYHMASQATVFFAVTEPGGGREVELLSTLEMT